MNDSQKLGFAASLVAITFVFATLSIMGCANGNMMIYLGGTHRDNDMGIEKVGSAVSDIPISLKEVLTNLGKTEQGGTTVTNVIVPANNGNNTSGGTGGGTTSSVLPFDMSKVEWVGHAYGDTTKAVHDPSVSVSVSGWDADGVDIVASPWPPPETRWPKCTIINAPDEQCRMHCAIVYENGQGGFKGSFWDHMCTSPCGRDFGNFRSDPKGNPHLGWDGQVEPENGTKCWVVLFSCDTAWFTTPAEGVWKRQ